MLAVLGNFVVDDTNLFRCMRTALAESLLEEVVALLECFFTPRGDIEKLAMKINKSEIDKVKSDALGR